MILDALSQGFRDVSTIFSLVHGDVEPTVVLRDAALGLDVRVAKLEARIRFSCLCVRLSLFL